MKKLDGVFDDNSVGFFSGSYEKLKEDVIRLIERPDLRQAMGERAQAYAFEKYSTKNIEELIRVIDSWTIK